MLSSPANTADHPPQIQEFDRVRLAEAYRLSEFFGEKIWKGWTKIPPSVLLVSKEYEFLIRHPHPSSDFTKSGHDPILQSDVYFRKRTYSPELQATFPVAGMIPTVVIGTAENTAKTSTPWILTVLHERFHQLQMSQPGYFQKVEKLNLSKGDQTGMWMLTFPFPYGDPGAARKISELASLLNQMLTVDFSDEKLSDYRNVKKRLQQSIKPDDYRYLCFQIWQEGIARYSEYLFANLAAEGYKPTEQFRSLKDFSEFASVGDKIRTEQILGRLASLHLERDRRVAFYPLGAGEGLLLDRIRPEWREHYFELPFTLDPLFPR